MTTKARQLAEFIANADVDSDEIATGAVSASKLAATLDLSGKTIVLPDLNQGVTITSPSNAEGLKLNGRSADDIGQLKFYENDGTTSLARLDARTTHFEVGSYNELRISAGGVGNNHLIVDASGRVKIGTTSNTPASADEPGFVFGDNTAGTATPGVASFVANGAAPLLLTRRTNDGNVLGIADDTTTRGLLRVDGGDLNVSSNANLRLSAGGSSAKMTILSGGNVGIGETSPDYRLEVKGTATTNTDIVGFSNSNGTVKHIFGLENVGAGRYSIRDASNNTAVFFSAHDADNSYVNAGSFLVGTTNADVGGSVTGVALRNTGAILASTDGTDLGYQPLYADRRGTNNEGDILMLALGGFYKSSIGVLGTNSSSDNGGITFSTVANNVTKTERVRINNSTSRAIVVNNFGSSSGQYGIGQGGYNGRAYTWMFANANYGSSGVALGFDNAGTITPGLLLNNGGNVGINSANPVSKLDVQYGSLGTWEGASSTPTLVVGQNDAYRGISLRTVGDSNVGPSFHFERTRASGGTTSDNDKLGQIVFNGTSGGYTDRITAEISVIQDGTAAAGWVPGTIQFKTTSVASSSTNEHVPRMTIKTDGNIEFTNNGTRSQYIGYKDYAYYFDYQPGKQTWTDATEAGNNALSHALMVRTPVRDSSNVAAIVIAENGGQATGRNGLWFRNEDFNGGTGYTKAKIYTEVGNSYNATSFYIDVANSSRNSTNRFQIDQNGTFYGSSSNNISDRRLKENIETITNPIEKIKGLTGRTFMWTEESTKADGKTKYGFIAQEVDTVVPDLVEKETGLTYFDDNNNIVEKYESTNAAMSVNETGVIPILVEALKEALTEIDDLKARIEALEG